MEPFSIELVFFGIVAVFLCAGAVAWLLEPRRRAHRALSGAAEKRLGAIGAGDRVRVRGVARRGQERRISPITGRECIGYRVVVDERLEEQWRTVLEKADCAPFELHAEGFTAQVDGPFLFGLEMDEGREDADVAPGILDSLERYGVSRVDEFGRTRKFRLVEARLEEGDPIHVLGRAALSVDQRGHRESPRGLPILRVISGTEREPTVLADAELPGVPALY